MCRYCYGASGTVNEKRRADAEPGVDRQPAAVRLDEAFDDPQPEAGAVALLAAHAPEAIEQVRQVLVGDPRPGVDDREGEPVALALGGER